MMPERLPGLFVVGTDTGVGKTYVASAIARAMVSRGWKVGAIKPVATGALRVGEELIAEDTERLREAIGGTAPRESITPLNFEEPVAPSVAARRLGFTLTPSVLSYLVNKLIRWWSERADVLVVEGIGGILCPVTEESTLIDLAIELDFPLVIVARRGLGTLNHTLLTVDSARLRGLRIAGIVLNASASESNSPAEVTNLAELSRLIPDVALLAELPHDPETLLPDALNGVDWYSLARSPRGATGSVSPLPDARSQNIMPSDVIEPREESSVPDMETPLVGETAGKQEQHAPPFIATPALSSTSSDELSLSLASARPDPLLGRLATPEPDLEPKPEPEPVAEAGESHARADAFEALAHLDVGAEREASDVSSAALAALHIESEPEAPVVAEKAAAPVPEAIEDDDEDLPRGVPLSTVLLFSWASAATLGLIWVLWTGRRLRESPEEATPLAAEAQADPGKRAGASRRIVPPPVIAADHLVTLGKTIRIGALEVTPLSVSSGPITLERTALERVTKDGGKNALVLRLRIKNLSTDKVLAPLDEAFLRERPRAEPDSFVETTGGETIPLYPIALESEWAIAGQVFRDLKPGESFESIVATAPDALDKTTPEMTWRIRLRTDINHTDDLGVRIQADAIKPGS